MSRQNEAPDGFPGCLLILPDVFLSVLQGERIMSNEVDYKEKLLSYLKSPWLRLAASLVTFASAILYLLGYTMLGIMGIAAMAAASWWIGWSRDEA